MKKRIVIILAVVLVILPFSVSVAGPTEPIIIKQLNYIPPTIALSKAIMRWYAELEKRSRGRIKIKHYWSASLASPKDIASYVAQNIVQAGQIGPGYNPQMFRLIRVSDLPFLSEKSDAKFRAIMEAYKVNKALRKEIEEIGLKVLFVQGPERGPLMSKKPAYKVEDFKGWKIRSYGGLGSIIKSWGAIPIEMPFPDVPEALQRGVIDSALGVFFSSFYGLKMHELTKYAIDPGERFALIMLECMSLKFYNSLPKDLQSLVDEMVEEGMTIYLEAYAKGVDNTARLLAPTPMEFISWSPLEIEKAKSLALPAANKVYFEEMKKRGIEKEARELYEFIVKKSKEYESQSIFPHSFELVEKYRQEKKQ